LKLLLTNKRERLSVELVAEYSQE
jgi:hypothetical protein